MQRQRQLVSHLDSRRKQMGPISLLAEHALDEAQIVLNRLSHCTLS